MKKYFHLPVLLCISWCLAGQPGFAQVDNPAGSPSTESALDGDPSVEESGSEEVEYNEDNYRRYMELKDRNQQRGAFAETSFQPQANFQRIAKLPEASQKHLRDQLREIILTGDQWKPGDEKGNYPYVPSEAARGNPELQQQEAEAWGELVQQYHQREAEIYANSKGGGAGESSGQRSASGSSQASQQGSDGSPGQDPGQNSGQDSAQESRQASNQDSQGSSDSQASESGSSARQQTETRRQSAQSADSYSTKSPNHPNRIKADGVSQNALEYLMSQGVGSQTSEQNVPQIIIANDDPSQRSAQAGDTLAIKDLTNAKGVLTGAQPGQGNNVENDPDGDNPKGKDGDG